MLAAENDRAANTKVFNYVVNCFESLILNSTYMFFFFFWGGGGGGGGEGGGGGNLDKIAKRA